MATATPRKRFDHDETQARVRSPLQTLRKYIRAYVILEGAALTMLCAAGLFWLGLAFDYGLYRFDIEALGVHGIDWIQELNDVDSTGGSSLWIRIILLAATAAGLIFLGVSKVVMRWLREFNDQALALVLERRYPKQLGDRLITAVELADPALSKKYGYSQAMVEKTILEAVDTLKGLPVAHVFNWARLRSLWLYVAGATAGMFLVTMAVFCVGSFVVGPEQTPYTFSWKFWDVASIWTERNILMMDTYWPRRAYLVVENYQPTKKDPNEMRVARDDARPDLQARALQWVIADRKEPSGWRPVLWNDLPGLVGADMVAAVVLPKQFERWKAGPIDDVAGEMSDVSIELRGKQEPGNCYDRLDAIFTKLQALADEPSMSRTLRKLDVPAGVEFMFRGEDRSSNTPVSVEKGNRYTFKLDDLKADSSKYRFRVRGEDYYTAPKNVILVPAPAPETINIDKEEPAYIYHRLIGVDQSALRGKKHRTKDFPLSITGDTNTIEIPQGSNLAIKVRTDRRLRAQQAVEIKNPVVLDPGYDAYRGAPPVLDSDHGGFTLVLNNVTRKHDFSVEFFDEDHIRGKRRFRVLAVSDLDPQLANLNVFSVILRKPKFKAQTFDKDKKGPPPRDRRDQVELAGAYLITPDALIPFECPVKDDYGLVRVGFNYKIRKADVELISQGSKAPQVLQVDLATQRYRTGLVIANLQFGPPNPLTWRFGPAHLAYTAELLQRDIRQTQGYKEAYVKSVGFEQMLERRAGKMIHPGAIDKALTQKASTAPWEFDFKDDDGFDVKKLLPELKAFDVEKTGQTHYFLQVAVQATDNNVETGAIFTDEAGQLLQGNTKKNKNGFVSFLVISENELLSQIAVEEELLSEKLEAAKEKIDAGITSLIEQQTKIRSEGVDLDSVMIRMNEIRTGVSTAGNTIREVHQAYNNILRELAVNRVRSDRLDKIKDLIVARLTDIVLKSPVDPNTGSYPDAEDQFAAAHDLVEKDVNDKRTPNPQLHGPAMADAQKKMSKLSFDLQIVLNAMSEGIVESKLIAQLATMERIQNERTRWFEQERLRLIEETLQKLIGDEKKDKK